ncbi:MAG: DUF86 domain-containing protein [Nitrospirae bacterium]|nr:DUF86 domain-containing protein [Nitrospirota bacterium]
MIDEKLIEKKLRRIEDFLREINNVEIGSLDKFKENIVTKRFVERNIELAIEQMVDICKHLVSGLDLSEPETYVECFDLLAKEEIILQENLDTFKAMIRFRNILIHAYDGVDDSITYGIYKQRLNDFKIFIREIRNYLLKAKE